MACRCRWKDLFDTAGVATEAGSALLKGRVPDARCRGAGAGDAGRAGLPGQDAHVGTGVLGPGAEPGDGHAALHQRSGRGAGGVILGRGGLGGLRAGPCGHRVGHRRIGADSGGLERSGRAEDHAWAAAADRRGAAVRASSTPSGRWPGRSRIARCCWARWRAGRRPTCGARACRARGSLVLETVALDDLRAGAGGGL